MKKGFVNYILGAIAVLLTITTAILLYTFVIKPGNHVVPDFIGKNVTEVYKWCATLDDMDACVISFEDTDEYEKDIVFEQSLPAGVKIKKNTIAIKVATGEGKEIILPFIDADTQRSDIEAWALTFGIQQVTYIEETSDTVAKNHVIRIEPDRNIRKDTPITVYISTGKKEVAPTDVTVKFGDYLNLTVEEFEAKAKELGLKPNHNEKRDQYDPHIEFGKIVWHGSGVYVPGETFNYGICVNELVIEAGKYVGKSEEDFIKIAKELALEPTHLSERDHFSTKVDKGNVVTHGSGVYVKNEKFNYGLSLGPAKIEPGYEGASEEVFLSYLEKFELKPNKQTATSDTVAKGRVISYNAGNYSSGDKVTYVVSLGPEAKIEVPDFSGKNEQELLDFISDKGLKVGIRSVQSSTIPDGKIISNDSGSKKKGDTINYVVSSGPFIPKARMDKFEYIFEMVSSDDSYEEAEEKMTLYLDQKGFTNYEIVPVFASSMRPGQLLMITVDGNIHAQAKDYPTYSQIEVQISNWLYTSPQE
ncbi:MAG: PASTA domain-containing protein [Erysipelotrichaceae bacterium]|jgi:beta-lactam-binding protein with PASTA domain|nr:PASTA domain-containing protein [Erysipelotrichaceae bacterium]